MGLSKAAPAWRQTRQAFALFPQCLRPAKRSPCFPSVSGLNTELYNSVGLKQRGRCVFHQHGASSDSCEFRQHTSSNLWEFPQHTSSNLCRSSFRHHPNFLQYTSSILCRSSFRHLLNLCDFPQHTSSDLCEFPQHNSSTSFSTPPRSCAGVPSDTSSICVSSLSGTPPRSCAGVPSDTSSNFWGFPPLTSSASFSTPQLV